MKRLLLPALLGVALFAFRASALNVNEINVANVVAVMNDYRAEAGLPPLRIDPSLTAAAETRMREMAEGEWWAHQAPDGTPPFVHIPIDYDYAFAAENLATGFETAGLLVTAWMESPGHRTNILGANYADCGISVLEGATTGPAMGKSVVVLFGKRKVRMVTAK